MRVLSSRSKRLSGCLLALGLCVILADYVTADAVVYDGFVDTTGLTLNQDAATVGTTDGTVLRLTPAAKERRGSAFSTALVDVTNFGTFFTFRITGQGGEIIPDDGNNELGADGLVFVVQSVSSTACGVTGGSLGYTGIGASVGVEFDAWLNSKHNDPSQSHVGIDLDGSTTHEIGASFTADVTGPELDDGHKWYVWIDYDGATLEARISLTSNRPDEAILSRELDIPGILGQGTGYMGFTSGTGSAWANHDIIYWTYVPEPATLLLLALGGLTVLRKRRRR